MQATTNAAKSWYRTRELASKRKSRSVKKFAISDSTAARCAAILCDSNWSEPKWFEPEWLRSCVVAAVAVVRAAAALAVAVVRTAADLAVAVVRAAAALAVAVVRAAAVAVAFSWSRSCRGPQAAGLTLRT